MVGLLDCRYAIGLFAFLGLTASVLIGGHPEVFVENIVKLTVIGIAHHFSDFCDVMVGIAEQGNGGIHAHLDGIIPNGDAHVLLEALSEIFFADAHGI